MLWRSLWLCISHRSQGVCRRHYEGSICCTGACRNVQNSSFSHLFLIVLSWLFGVLLTCCHNLSCLWSPHEPIFILLTWTNQPRVEPTLSCASNSSWRTVFPRAWLPSSPNPVPTLPLCRARAVLANEVPSQARLVPSPRCENNPCAEETVEGFFAPTAQTLFCTLLLPPLSVSLPLYVHIQKKSFPTNLFGLARRVRSFGRSGRGLPHNSEYPI